MTRSAVCERNPTLLFNRLCMPPSRIAPEFAALIGAHHVCSEVSRRAKQRFEVRGGVFVLLGVKNALILPNQPTSAI